MSILSLFLPNLSKADAAAAANVVRSSWVGPGEKVEAFEASLAKWLNTDYCVCTSSGTAAIMAALMCHAESMGNPLLIAPAYGHPAAINAALLLGYQVVLCDVSPTTGVMKTEDLRHILSNGLACCGGVIVHVEHNGCTSATVATVDAVPAEYRKRWLVLQDSCQSMHNRPTLQGDAMVVSFSPQKIITTGQGGAILTNQAHIAGAVRRLVSHGRGQDQDSRAAVGVNLRMSDIAAAVGLSQMDEINVKAHEWRVVRSWYDKERQWVWCPCVQTEYPVRLITALSKVLVGGAMLYKASCNVPAIWSRVSAYSNLQGAKQAAAETVYLPGHHRVRASSVRKAKEIIDALR